MKKIILLFIGLTAAIAIYCAMHYTNETAPPYDWEPQIYEETISLSPNDPSTQNTFTILSEPQIYEKQITVKTGQEFIISLSQTRWTRDGWGATFDREFLNLVSSKKTKNLTKKNTQASQYVPQTFEFRFQPLKPGTTTLTLNYGNHWLDQPRQINTYTITIE